MSHRDDVIRVVEASVLVNTIDRAARGVWRAASGSLLIGGIAAAWRPMAAHAGVLLAAATVTHLGFTVTLAAPPPGWLWLLLPAMAGAVAVGLMIVQRQASRRHRE